VARPMRQFQEESWLFAANDQLTYNRTWSIWTFERHVLS